MHIWVIVAFSAIQSFAWECNIGVLIKDYESIFQGHVIFYRQLNKPKKQFDSLNIQDREYLKAAKAHNSSRKIADNLIDSALIGIVKDKEIKGNIKKDTIFLRYQISKGWWYTNPESDSMETSHDWEPNLSKVTGIFGIYRIKNRATALFIIPNSCSRYDLCKENIINALLGEKPPENVNKWCFGNDAIIIECNQ
jgi:hypothetical protein